MINVGGFGHSGNTALVDFFADSVDVCPVGYDYTESALIRSKWGIKAIFDNFESDQLTIKWSNIEDCLLGQRKDEHNSDSPPVHHDFTRNARVSGYLGSEYKTAVKDFIYKIQNAYVSQRTNYDLLQKLTNSFLIEVMNLSIKKSGNNTAVPLLRNDPAAANIDLLKYSICSKHYSLIRNPDDMMYDWINYYNHSNDVNGAKLFSRQFVKKLEDFIFKFENLPVEFKDKVKILRFEDLVLNEDIRMQLYASNSLRAPEKFGRFNPEASKNNIGIGAKLNEDAVEVLKTVCIPKYSQFIERIPTRNLIS